MSLIRDARTSGVSSHNASLQYVRFGLIALAMVLASLVVAVSIPALKYAVSNGISPDEGEIDTNALIEEAESSDIIVTTSEDERDPLPPSKLKLSMKLSKASAASATVIIPARSSDAAASVSGANEAKEKDAANRRKGPSESLSAVDKEDHENRESAFTEIYRKNMWSSAESRSGVGSEVVYTANIRRFLGLVFPAYGIKSLLDSPCGDCNWQPHIPGFNDTSYVGVDIVKDVIEANKVKNADRSNMKFHQVDLAVEPLPEGTYDAVLCRDLIQHLTLKAGMEAYRRIEGTGARYLLTSFHSEAGKNREIYDGAFRYSDPMLPPFNFSPPIMYALEGKENWIPTTSRRVNYKMVGLWRLPALGKGNGQCLAPIKAEAVNGTLVILEKDAAQKLQDLGFSNFSCHYLQGCQ